MNQAVVVTEAEEFFAPTSTDLVGKAAGLTASRLREALVYDPETGLFSWRPKPGKTKHERAWNTRYAGSEAGATNAVGYRQVQIDGRIYLAHRLAWLYMTGEWPTDDIDHQDRVRTNNQWSNLRAATRTQNNGNAALRRDNTSGVKGVYWHQGKGKWHARIKCSGIDLSLGYHSSLRAAAAAYAKAAKDMFGEFAFVGGSE